VVYFTPQRCEGSVIEQLCSSVTSFLDDEAAKAGADAKACKDKCGWKKRKNDLITTARKKAKDSCAKGEAPDINEVSKGLDGNAKEKLNGLYDQNTRMFDGTTKLSAKDFDVKSGQAPAITGKGGQVADLKSSGPDIPKLNTVSEFSLAKPSAFLASTKTATATSLKATELNCLNGLKPMDCKCPDGRNFGMLCIEDCYPKCMSVDGGTGGWDKFIAGAKKYWEDAKTVIKVPGELAKAAWNKAKEIANDYQDDIATIGKWVWDGFKWVWKETTDRIKGAIWRVRRIFNDEDATVVCDDNGGYKIQLNFAAGAPCGIKECMIQHEQIHINDIKAKFGTSICAGASAGTGIEFTWDFRCYTECRASSADIVCLSNKLSQGPSSYCRGELNKRMEIAKENRQEYCSRK